MIRPQVERMLEVLDFLRTDGAFLMAQLSDLSALDYQEKRRLVLVYRLARLLPLYDSAVVKVEVDRDRPVAPTVSDRWGNADWLEREVYDMFGVWFEGHPNLERIMLWSHFEGHPLRKDFQPSVRREIH